MPIIRFLNDRKIKKSKLYYKRYLYLVNLLQIKDRKKNKSDHQNSW